MIKDNLEQKSTYLTHGFHPYPAKFTPQLVNKYLSLFCKPGYRILDPFCGSGTSLFESKINGMKSCGIDLNPIAYIISKAKTNSYSKYEIKEVIEHYNELKFNFTDRLFSNYGNIINKIEIPDFPNRDHWFQLNMVKELAFLKSFIFNIKNEVVKDLFKCAFSKIIVKSSNQDSEVRYTAKEKNLQNGFAINLFLKTLFEYINVINGIDYKNLPNCEVYNGDSVKVLRTFEDNCFDFVITSPPYINTFDYYLYHKLRMFWLGYDHRPVRAQEIGNHHRIDTKTFENAKLEYIQSMTELINELSRVLNNNRYFVMVIGDGIVDGKTIDMSIVIKEICKKTNFKINSIENVNLSDITKSFNRKFSNALKKEHYIILENNKT